MIALSLLLGIALQAGTDSIPPLPQPAERAEVAAPIVPSDSALRRFAPIATAPGATRGDTAQRRPRVVEMSDAYALRLRIHRIGSYAILPLFATQMIAGNQLYQGGGDDPRWALRMHQFGAGALATLFTVNTVTGGWNLWESRGVEQGRTARFIHSGLMLAADAGFTYAGAKLGPEATRSGAKRIEHRRLAYISIGTALAGYATMFVANK